jgi:hypothetical protein
MNIKLLLQGAGCTIIAGLFSLTTHIYMMKLVQPYIDAIMQQASQQGINFNPDPSSYSFIVVGAAYLTAILMIAAYVFLYYHAQYMIPGKTNLTKIVAVTAILFCLKGDLIRQPIMNFIMNFESMSFITSFKLVILDHIDKWLANVLLAFCLVYFCPKKK